MIVKDAAFACLLLLLLLATACGLRKKEEEETFQTPLEQYRDEDFYSRGPLQDTGHFNLVLVRYQANYDEAFTPTIEFQVQNTGTKTVSSFEVEANLGTTKSFFDQCVFRKTYTVTLPPGQGATLSYQVLLGQVQESCNDYPSFHIVKEVCSDSSVHRKL